MGYDFEKIQTVVDAFLKSEKIPTDSFGPRFVPEILIPLVSYLFERVKSAGKVKLCSLDVIYYFLRVLLSLGLPVLRELVKVRSQSC
jgi:hypothetical protein